MRIVRTAAILLIFCAAFPLAAGILFGSSDLNDNDEVLFTVRQSVPGTVSYRSLFYVKIENGAASSLPHILTCYPEQMELLLGGTVLQIRNRYGTARFSTENRQLEWSSRTAGLPVNSMRLSVRSVSPDGKWSCYIEKTGYAEGSLVFVNSLTGKKSILDKHAPFRYDTVPVKWAPDSSIFLYSRNDTVYFCDPDAVQRGVQMDEKYCEIGTGSIDSVCWSGSSLFYIDSDIVYKIDIKGLYTTGLYSGVIGKGTPCGRLPEHFDFCRDIFSVNAENTSLFLIKGGRIFSCYSLLNNSCDYAGVIFSRPYTSSYGSLLDAVILWSSSGEPYVWLQLMPYSGGEPQSAVYKIADSIKPLLSIENSCRPIISSDGTLAAFFSGSTVYVYNVSTWKRVGQLSGENMVSAVWGGNTVLYVGGDHSVRRWDIVSDTSTDLFLSTATDGMWDEKTGQIIADSGNGKTFMLDQSMKLWTEMSPALKQTASMQNGRYRVFNGTTQNELYENALYIRTLSGKAVTRPVYSESVQKVSERRKTALIFDAYDSSDGLPFILSTLNKYKVTGTFCLNGEFIQRYPSETKQIAATRNRCASLFFSPVDLTGKDFIADESFVRRGLARNEDEFYQCTGYELSLLWHAPYYHATDAVRDAGKKAGYSYIDVIDGGINEMTLEDSVKQHCPYLSAAQIIEKNMTLLKKNNGGIISVSVGFAYGLRTEYVYQNLDLLISAILDEGFDIVNAGELAN
ncbi:MAG: polysaccharide deacetylase family protein [Treponema sp.]|nr:polysaccharide deacetylase family protein [Treponema sp.]